MCWTSTNRMLPKDGERVAVITQNGVITGGERMSFLTDFFRLDDGTETKVAYWQAVNLALEGLKPAPAGGEQP